LRCFDPPATLILLLALASAPVASQEILNTDTTFLEEDDLLDEFAFLEESATVELAARHKQQIGMSPSAIWVITREDIETSGADNFTDLLRLVPGMGVIIPSRFFEANVGRHSWGCDNTYWLLLIDGRDANLELLGFLHWHEQPISMEDVERIEVIRGPGSALYGANAVGGVISITTRAIQEKNSGWMGFYAGEAGTLTGAARTSFRIGNWGISLNAGFDSTGAYTDPEGPGRDAWKFRSVFEYVWSDTRRLTVDAGMGRGSGLLATLIGPLDATVRLNTLRVAYRSEDIRGHLYWSQLPVQARLQLPLEYGGVTLAEISPADTDSHVIDGEVQWTAPRFFDPLLLIVGAGGRITLVESDQFLDRGSFADPTSSRYHQLGADIRESRAGVFLHAELQPSDWVTVTAGARFDYNTTTDEFISPRLAAVFAPAPGHFLRAGAARAFRKPSLLESRVHLSADFPGGSPITGTAQDEFLEFMTRVLGNPNLEDEEVYALELGYLGQFLDGRLTVNLELFYNFLLHEIAMDSRIIPDAQGLPDLDDSSFMFENTSQRVDIFGGELAVRFSPSKWVSLLAAWSYKELYFHDDDETSDQDPKNLITLGGRFRTEWGLLGSLYAFIRTEFVDRGVQNPNGLFAPMLSQKMDDTVLFMGKLGWSWSPMEGLQLQIGAKLFLPVSPCTSPHFRFRDEGGGVTATGQEYGGMELARVVTAYLEGSF
jgi:iron complex outermembrane receptor protein